jgi:AGZA family xanthine/uracil permease-like MFS transporter
VLTIVLVSLRLRGALLVSTFTFSITNGVGAGFIAYTVIAVARGRFRDIHWLLYLVSAVFVSYFVRGLLA